MTELDLLASESHFVDHLAPVWRALPDQVRGRFVTPASLVDHAARRGITATTDVAGRYGPILVASYGDQKVARRSGRRSIAYIEHGIGQSYSSDQPSYAGGRDRDDASLFLTPNETAAARWRARYPGARVEVVGSPRLDELPRKVSRETVPTIALSFHWNAAVSPEARSAFGWYYRDLASIAATGRILGHAHPRAMRDLDRRYRKLGFEVVPDFDDVLREADLYVCDNSSTIYEFASTGRPVVVLNAPWYRRTARHGLRFWDAADVGIQVDTPAELVPAIARALLDRPDQVEKREEALSIVYQLRVRGAESATGSAAAVKALLDWLATV